MTDDISDDWGRRTFLKATGAVGAAAAFAGLSSATPTREPGTRPNEILVGVTNTYSVTDVASATANDERLPDGMSVTHENDDLSYMALSKPEVTTMSDDDIIETLESLDHVRYAEFNETLHALGEPNDPRFGDQYAPQLVNAPAAWDTTLGSEDVTVAVIDQGVKYDHPDLTGQFGSNKGKDFVDSDGDPYPDSMADEYHGTHVAGIASATTNNGDGIAGMSNSTVLSGRALSEQGSGSTSDIADAVQWAADQGADIVNMSLGGGGYTNTMKNAVSYAADNGVTIICASGNDSSGSVSYPAAYDECIAVGAIDQNENLASFSNYGEKQDVVAPGVNILSTWTDSPYNKISGTSMACPAAVGVAALGLAANPGWSNTELRSQLKNTAVDVGLPENQQGAGRVDAANLVGSGDDPDPPENEAPTVSIDASAATVTVGQEITFDGSGSSDADGSISAYEWSFGDGATATGQTVAHAYSEAGDYSASLTVTDDDGATTTDSVAITVESEDGGSCGDESSTGSADGYLYGYYDSDDYTWTNDLQNPCQVTISLSGGNWSDFDLYVTTDGRTPTTSDYDKRSITPDSQEQITLDDVSSGQEIGVLVDSYSGSGSYTVNVEELGQ